jgi:opacity protein-like surface antigen
MKRIFYSSALLAALTLPVLAGTEMAPTPDGKDMKDVKQVSQQAAQSDAGFYVAALGGANFDTWYGDKRQSITTAGGSTVTSHNEIDSNWGGVGGIKAGYNFNSFSIGGDFLRIQPGVEGEALYIGEDRSHASGVFGPANSEEFSTNSAAFFLNGILRFKNKSIVTPYIGLGIGMQYLTEHGQITTPGGSVTGLDTSDFDPAGQAIFGIDVAVCQHISIFSEYKFIDAIGTDAKNSSIGGGATYRFKPDQIQQNLITAGVKYTF